MQARNQTEGLSATFFGRIENMKANIKDSFFYVFSVFLLLSACAWVSSIGGKDPTRMPLPSDTPTVETTATSAPTAGPAAAPGSFEDFHSFAARIDTALQNGDTAFFDEHLSISSWLCMGEPDAIGVCKDVPADTMLEGIPVTYDWKKYEVPGREDYRARWQAAFTSGSALKLTAIANQFGDNPLMPMASQSFFAIVSVADGKDPASVQEVRVLFFEYHEDAWHLAGELVSVENAAAWLAGTCSPMCYDTWSAWPE